MKLQSLFDADKAKEMTACDRDAIEAISKHIAAIRTEVKRMTDARKAANRIENEREKAVAYHDNVVPAMDSIRYHIDKLELMVDNEMWPLPKYREMLFIR